MASNLTLTGDSALLAVNSYIDVDFGPAADIDDWYVHNMLVLEDSSTANIYGCSFEPYVGTYSQRAPAIAAGGIETSPATPSVKGPADNTAQDLAWLAAVDGYTYEVEAQETMEIETWDVGGLDDASLLSSASLTVTYTPASTYAGTRAIEWAPDGLAYVSTGIVPDETDGTTSAV